ncbi:MAG: c-type cytochrome [Planctomycetes bacterium]|nr:c-type cytochrome [Planctomycetota bacterium]
MQYKIILLICSTCFLGCSEQPKEQAVAQEEPTIQTGEEIYLMYCASCHGQTGDGKGLIELDRPARSFIDGGFSFGNTVEAIAKTTRSGIPGTPMPPFVDVLTSEEIIRVVQHVRQFAPTMKEVLPNETEMVVKERPAVARGMIPPIQDGLQLHPRGLLVGNPDGLSYEYRVDDVRLLGIRQGKFVERTDWTGRGGSPLKPLGIVVVLVENGNPNGMFQSKDGEPLHAKLKSTNVSTALGIVQYDLLDDEGKIYATVAETCKPTTGVRALIEQQLLIHAQKPFLITIPTTATMDDASAVPAGKHTRTIIHAARESN